MRPMVLPLGYRGVKDEAINSILEDGSFNQSEAEETEMSTSETYNEVDMSTTSSVRTPVPILRVRAQEMDEDALGLDDDELNYYDSDASV